MGLVYRGKLCRDNYNFLNTFIGAYYSLLANLLIDGRCCICGNNLVQSEMIPIKFKRKKDKGKKVYGHACPACLEMHGLKKRGDKFKLRIVDNYKFMYEKDALRVAGGFADMGAKKK